LQKNDTGYLMLEDRKVASVIEASAKGFPPPHSTVQLFRALSSAASNSAWTFISIRLLLVLPRRNSLTSRWQRGPVTRVSCAGLAS
jgi:hypothetical protein